MEGEQLDLLCCDAGNVQEELELRLEGCEILNLKIIWFGPNIFANISFYLLKPKITHRKKRYFDLPAHSKAILCLASGLQLLKPIWH